MTETNASGAQVPCISLLARTIEMEEPTTIEYALKLMTDDWIDEGQYSPQTVFDLRDALRQAVSLVRELERQIEALEGAAADEQ